jgi:hypothetical protein
MIYCDPGSYFRKVLVPAPVPVRFQFRIPTYFAQFFNNKFCLPNLAFSVLEASLFPAGSGSKFGSGNKTGTEMGYGSGSGSAKAKVAVAVPAPVPQHCSFCRFNSIFRSSCDNPYNSESINLNFNGSIVMKPNMTFHRTFTLL